MEIVIGLVVGLAAAVGVYWIGRRELGRARTDAAQLRGELDTVKDAAGRVEIAKASAESERDARIREAEGFKRERDRAREALGAREQELSELNARLATVEADHAARVEEMDKFRAELEERFKGIASSVTQSTREDFIKEFRDLTKQQTETSLELVGNTVKPLRESLERLDKGTQEMEKARANAYADLRRSLLQSNEAIGALRHEASGLRQALRSPQVRGLWGEQQLQNVLEASGLREHVDFGQQVTSGSGRPDVVVQIPGERSVVIDAKTPLDSYLNALEAGDDKTERDLLTAHANSLFNHARSLGQKDYSQQIEDALDFVILFVPSDAILDAALRVRPELFEQSWSQHRVLMATPGSLIAFLRAVAQVWQQQSIQENAAEIAATARELYDRLGTYSDHVDKMGRSLGQTVAHYNRSVGSFQSRVLSSARKIEDLSDIEASRRIDDPAPLEEDVRQLAAPELDSPAADRAGSEDSAPYEQATAGVDGEDLYDEIADESYGDSDSLGAALLEALRNEAGGDGSDAASPAVRPTTQRPRGFTLWGEMHDVRTYREVLQGVVNLLYLRHADHFEQAFELRGRTRQYVTYSPNDHNMPLQVLDSSFWIEGNHSGQSALKLCGQLLEHFGYRETDLIVHYP